MPRSRNIGPMNASPHSERTSEIRRAHQAAVALWLALVFVIGGGEACAESVNVVAGATRAVAAAHVDFRIVVPKVLRINGSDGTIFTNARRAETIVIAALDPDLHHAVASRSDPSSIRVAIATLARVAGRSPAGYTVAMP